MELDIEEIFSALIISIENDSNNWHHVFDSGSIPNNISCAIRNEYYDIEIFIYKDCRIAIYSKNHCVFELMDAHSKELKELTEFIRSTPFSNPWKFARDMFMESINEIHRHEEFKEIRVPF